MRSTVCVALVAIVLASGCSNKKPVIPADKLWAEGNQAFTDEAYELAIQRYKTLLDQHPFDPNAEEAELKVAQAHYLNHRYAEAISSFGDFERMHPTSQNLAMVEYHLGLAYLEQASTSDRDQQSITNAQTYFRNLVDRFPSSPWTDRARLRLRECREFLARHEADIAAYYLRHDNLRAAEARLRGLLTEYPETDATADSLYLFATAYGRRAEGEGASLALATLLRHHPEGPLAVQAREQLGHGPKVADEDPLPELLAHLDRMRTQSDRVKVRESVSAYPNPPGGGGGGQY
jgi:outer membrane protein assembly factor BamD